MLSIRGLHRSFGVTRAVQGIDLHVAKGEVLGLLGPNGAGKSTTVNLAVGLLTPDSGTIDLAGLGSPTNPAARRRLGVAPQSLAIYETLTARENLDVFGRVCGLRGAELEARIAWALAFVGLTDRARDRAETYSGGMKRRLNLAVALVHDPDVILLDEPTVGVDPQSRNLVLEGIRTLRAAGKAVVYTTHYMEEAEKICDRVAIIDHGKILAEGTVADLVRAHGGLPTLVARTADGQVHHITTASPIDELDRLARDQKVEHFALETPDLERVFLELTGRKLRDT